MMTTVEADAAHVGRRTLPLHSCRQWRSCGLHWFVPHMGAVHEVKVSCIPRVRLIESDRKSQSAVLLDKAATSMCFCKDTKPDCSRH